MAHAIFQNTKLRDANLDGAILLESNLCGADLTQSSLVKANLAHADFLETILVQTNLHGSSLEQALHLTKGRLSKAKTLLDAKMDPALSASMKEAHSELFKD